MTPETLPPETPVCERCGQVTLDPAQRCTCRQAPPQPTETLRLFEPAPEQLAGQLGMPQEPTR